MIETLETGSPKIVGFKLHGKLHDEDYKSFVPAVDAAVAAEGKVRLFAQFEDFHGWDLHAAWDDFKFGLKHYSDFERIAMVGEREMGSLDDQGVQALHQGQGEILRSSPRSIRRGPGCGKDVQPMASA